MAKRNHVLDECSVCGYNNKLRHNTCPICGANLKERKKRKGKNRSKKYCNHAHGNGAIKV